MKFILSFFAMLLVSGGALAATTINLAPAPCGLSRSCSPATDTGDIVQFNAAYGNFVRLYLNGTLYSSPGFQSLTNFESYALATTDGRTLLLTAHFTTSRVCVRSGRGQHCSENWYLTDGNITR